MNESYVELLVKRKKNTAATVLSAFLYGVGGLAFLGVVLTGGVLIFFIAVALLGSAYYIQYSSNIEYEYLYLDKEFSVDKIKNQTGRKRVATYDMTLLEILAPAGSRYLDSYSGRSDIQTYHYESNYEDSNPYAMIVKDGTKTVCLIIETNEELLTQISRIAPRKVYKD